MSGEIRTQSQLPLPSFPVRFLKLAQSKCAQTAPATIRSSTSAAPEMGTKTRVRY